MIITDEAKEILKDVMKSNGGDSLKAFMQQSCCGTSFMVSVAKLTEDDNPVIINGIPVLIDDGLNKRSESVTITVEKGKLIIQDAAALSCGS